MILAIVCLIDILGTRITAEAAQLITEVFLSKIWYKDRGSKLYVTLSLGLSCQI